jgi:hypothetical protein
MMEMKKGKANVPPQMRGQFKKQQEMAAMQRQMVDAQKPGSDGMPVFNLFVRTKRQNVSSNAKIITEHFFKHLNLTSDGGFVIFLGLVSMWIVQGR